MATATKSSLQSLLSGAPMPLIPRKLEEQPVLYHYLEELEAYLRRLLGNLTETNIINAITQIEGLSASTLTAWKYNSSTHKWQVKTQTVYVLKKDAESGWTDAPDGSQPVVMSQVQRDTNYSTSTHILDKDTTANVYVLEKGADTNDTNVDTATTCGS